VAKLLLQQLALGRLELRLGGALVTAWLRGDDFTAVGADEGYSEGLVDTLRRIKGAKVAALVREREKDGGVECKVSLRSTDGAVNVAALAARKGGGGHIRAAGFTTQGGVAETLDWLEAQLKALL
ncbi:MAG TPA: DHHA1 domain-containing protein, partial [Thermoleophilia bacterium]